MTKKRKLPDKGLKLGQFESQERDGTYVDYIGVYSGSFIILVLLDCDQSEWSWY